MHHIFHASDVIPSDEDAKKICKKVILAGAGIQTINPQRVLAKNGQPFDPQKESKIILACFQRIVKGQSNFHEKQTN